MRKITCILLVMLLGLPLSAVTGFASSETSEKLKDAEQEKKAAEEKLDQAMGTLDSLKDSKEALEDSLDNLNDQLTEVAQRIAVVEDRIREKQQQIEQTRLELEEAEKEAADYYAYIKSRLRVIYERGNDTYMDLLFNSGSFAQFMNKAVYIEKMNEYDRQMLQNMQELRDETRRREEQLQAEEQELEGMRSEVMSEQDKVKDLVDSTSSSITSYAGAISEKEREALAWEQSIIAKQNTIEALKDQLAKEEELARRAQAMGKRNLSEVDFNVSDRDLLAAIIQCEAGGEPWEGKIAVGAVIMNRVCSEAFPNTVAGVVYQSGQFQPVASGRLAIRLAEGANDECYRAADAVMSGSNNIGNCLFFRTVVPGIHGTIIGHHVFYLYWTGRESGYGTVEESIEGNAKKPEDEEGAAEEEEDDSEEEEEDAEEEEENTEEEEGEE
ncbi:MAG: cell wall hydrolase [Lachnospiraceae bacterium]|nr:cell wall hydrolase [Lachnospiraceae bacterium]